MTIYSKINIIYRLQKWMDSVPGQTFLNYAYSWGASIVILGTLFKLTHLPGANFFLFLGMGTEVFVFFISAFDRPFDKTADGLQASTRVVVLSLWAAVEVMLLPLAVLALLVEPVVALSLSAVEAEVMLLPLVFLVEQAVALSLSVAVVEVMLLPLVFLVEQAVALSLSAAVAEVMLLPLAVLAFLLEQAVVPSLLVAAVEVMLLSLALLVLLSWIARQ